MSDVQRVEVGDPLVDRVRVVDVEGDVIETGTASVERAGDIGVGEAVQAEAGRAPDRGAVLVWRAGQEVADEDRRLTEQRGVPRHAAVEVADGEGDVGDRRRCERHARNLCHRSGWVGVVEHDGEDRRAVAVELARSDAADPRQLVGGDRPPGGDVGERRIRQHGVARLAGGEVLAQVAQRLEQCRIGGLEVVART